jgi:hypothetical protein
MVGLLDIAPLQKEVTVRNVKLLVGGISATGIVSLMTEFPEIKNKLAGMDVKITPERVVQMGPEVVCGIIAAGLGHPGDEAYKHKASELVIGEQFDIIVKILEVTFPQGVGPFAESLRGIARDAGIDVSGWGQDTISHAQSSE